MYKLGDIVTFWISNKHGLKDFYEFEIKSPGLSEDQIPLVTLSKINESTKYYPRKLKGLFNLIYKDDDNIDKRGVLFTEGTLENKVFVDYGPEPGDFPVIEMEDSEGNHINPDGIFLKLIERLRERIRRKHYSFIKDGDEYDLNLKNGNYVLRTTIKNGDLYCIPVSGTIRNTGESIRSKLLSSIHKNLTKKWIQNTISYNGFKTFETGTGFLFKLKQAEINDSNIIKILKSLEWNSMTKRF